MADHEMGDNEEHAMQEAEVPLGPTAGAAAQREDYSMGGDTERRHPGRLVNLRRGRDGSYQILMRDRVIQGFCSEFEDITSWRQPLDTQIQARINIVPTGRLRGAYYPEEIVPLRAEGFETDRLEVRTRGLMPHGPDSIPAGDDGVQLESIAHPSNASSWQVEALRHLQMERDQLSHTIDMIESLRRR